MRADSGFTLIEALLGLVLGSAAIVVAGAGVTAAVSTQHQASSTAVAVEDLAAAAALRNRLLRQATPLKDPERAAQTRWMFDGDEQSVRFAALILDATDAPGLWEVSIALLPGSPRKQLQVSGRPLASGVNGRTSASLSVTEVNAAARFSYGGVDREGNFAWRRSWAGADGWPAAIAFDADGDGPSPPLIASLNQPGPDP